MKATKNIFSNLNGDAFGGVTAGIVALPLALAFGEQTELGAIAGLYGAIILGIVAAVLGGTKTQISGPTAPMTVVSALVIAQAVKDSGSLDKALPMIVATFVMAGIIEMLLGIMRVGKYIRYIPYPVVSGFMSGIGIIIIITQIFPFFGVNAPAGGPLGTVRDIHKIPEIVNIASMIGAIGTIVIIYLLPRLTKKIPAALAALLIMSIGAYFVLPEGSILRINSRGAIPTGLPAIQLGFLSVFSDFQLMMKAVEYAATLAALGTIDSLLTSVVADNMTKTKHNSNQELIGQGIGNAIAGIFGGLPGAGATMRTVININSGGKTKISGVIAGIFLLTVLLGIGPLVGHIPNAVLAGILITVGIGIIDYRGLKHFKTIPRTDAAVMVIVMFLTVWVDLLIAVAAGMVLSSLLFMKKTSDLIEQRSQSASLRKFSREIAWKDEGDIIERAGDQVYIKHLDGPLFFGFVSRFSDMIKAIPTLEVLVIRMDRVPYVDQSGLYALEEGIQDLQARGIKVVFTDIHGQPKDMLQKIKLVPDLVPRAYCFETFAECAVWIEKAIDHTGKLDPDDTGRDVEAVLNQTNEKKR